MGESVVDWLQRSSTLVLGVGVRGYPSQMAAIFQTTFLPPVFIPTPTIYEQYTTIYERVSKFYERARKASAHCPNGMVFNGKE